MDRRGPGWDLLNEMYATKKAADLTGAVHDLEVAGVPQSTGLVLYDLIRTHKPTKTIETGFAFGFSTLFILQALADNGGGTHEAIDPVEIVRWHGIGLANVRRAGWEGMFSHLDLASSLALPSHLINGDRFDFAFVDGSHLFDDTLLDAYYMDKIVNVGGLIVFDDWGWMPAVKAVTSFIETNWSYRVVSVPDASNIRVLQKVSGPNREWNHFVPFEVTSYEELKRTKDAASGVVAA